ncbi:MAG: type II toxin-antitoxin system HipA family toxin [Verrucomicrobia bacterium]|nr:type II toxin-antitoxin system HipA family toxin [Verrucomicrobiota bacterium]
MIEVRYLGGGEDLLVGRLTQSAGRVFFEYDGDWRGRGLELSPYVLPLSEDRAVAPPDNKFQGLYSLFADSLPDWWGEKLLRRHVEAQGRVWRDLTPLDKLCLQGDRTVGALGYEPDAGMGEEVGEFDLEGLASSAVDVLAGETDRVIAGLLRTGHTAGGAQPKVVLGLSEDRRSVVSGEGVLPEGFSHWLVKFDLEPVLEDGRAEMLCGLAARAAGIEMPEVAVLEDGSDRAHFAVRRFDRRGHGERVHVQTFTALSGRHVEEQFDYSDLMDMTRDLTRDHRQVEQMFRRAVFNVLLGNEDDHGKNHAFLMEADGEWKLAPAYDLTQTGHPVGGGMRACGVMGRAAEVRREDLLALAAEHGVRGSEKVIDEVWGVLSRLEDFAVATGISVGRMEELREGLRGAR